VKARRFLETDRAYVVRTPASQSAWLGVGLLLLAALACGAVERTESTLPPVSAPPSASAAPTDAKIPASAGGTATPGSGDGSPQGPAISLLGSATFVGQAQAALELLASCAPEAVQTVDRHMNAIQESERSGMLVDTGIFLASSTTAFAPGYPPAAQVYWFAGAIVHDAQHSEQKAQGVIVDWSALSLPEREVIEADARGVQIEVLEDCLGALSAPDQASARYMLAYLQDMQAGVIPCDYCAVEWENRDW